MQTFQETGLRQEILDAISILGFVTPTPIQAQAIPHILTSDQDLIAAAQTGTGKTAAFGLPVLHHIDPEVSAPQALILAPTRELCLQITKDITNYAKKMKGVGVVAVYGGARIDTQMHALRSKAQIIVATPGRAVDLINRKALKLGGVKRVVLDEADEMLSMGFKEDLNTILAQTPQDKQVLLFSATMSGEVQNITKTYMHEPHSISVAKVNTGSSQVSHQYYMVHAADRYELLKRIADINPDIYGIVFCRTRRETKEVANKLMSDGYNADVLYGDLTQSQRDDVMSRFRSGQLQMLVATDVAARGLDVDNLTHVINYSLPDDAEVYTHRSGRTGRAGKKGISIVIIHTRELRKIKQIERESGVAFTEEKAPSGKDICSRQLLSLIDKIQKVQVDEDQIAPFLPEIYEKLGDFSREDLIKHFVSAEFNRFLTYYRGARDISLSAGPAGTHSRDDRVGKNFTPLAINLGARHRFNAKSLLGLINTSTGSSDVSVGKIQTKPDSTIFEVQSDKASLVQTSVTGKIHDGITIVVSPSSDAPSGRPRGGGGYGSGFRGRSDRRGPRRRKRHFS